MSVKSWYLSEQAPVCFYQEIIYPLKYNYSVLFCSVMTM